MVEASAEEPVLGAPFMELHMCKSAGSTERQPAQDRKVGPEHPE
jgi:hypothetical protein